MRGSIPWLGTASVRVSGLDRWLVGCLWRLWRVPNQRLLQPRPHSPLVFLALSLCCCQAHDVSSAPSPSVAVALPLRAFLSLIASLPHQSCLLPQPPALFWELVAAQSDSIGNQSLPGQVGAGSVCAHWDCLCGVMCCVLIVEVNVGWVWLWY